MEHFRYEDIFQSRHLDHGRNCGSVLLERDSGFSTDPWLAPGGAFICYVLSAIVEVTVKRLVGDELLELRRQSNATANRLDLLDRKVTAILRDALEQRRLR